MYHRCLRSTACAGAHIHTLAAHVRRIQGLGEDQPYMEIVPEVLKNYGQAIRHGHRHIYRSLPRMLTVWFDFGSTCAAQKTPPGKVRAALMSAGLL